MDWIKENFVYMLAGLGALYAVALFIVKLTPTPRDDEALKEVSLFVRWLAKLFGLDLKQGRVKKPKQPKPPRADGQVLGVALVGTILLLGCAGPGDRYQASSFAFVAAADAATELRKADRLTEDEVKAISIAIEDGNRALNLWGEGLKRDEDYPDGQAIVALAVSRIREAIVAARARPPKEK